MSGKRNRWMAAAGLPPADVRLPHDVQGHLGAQLRAAYAKLVREPIPQKLIDLLQRLEAKERTF